MFRHNHFYDRCPVPVGNSIVYSAANDAQAKLKVRSAFLANKMQTEECITSQQNIRLFMRSNINTMLSIQFQLTKKSKLNLCFNNPLFLHSNQFPLASHVDRDLIDAPDDHGDGLRLFVHTRHWFQLGRCTSMLPAGAMR